MFRASTINKSILTAILLVLAATFACPILSVAQTNKFKINDKLYPIYEEAEKKRYSDEGLRLAKELDRKAIELGDKKAQCLAHTIPLYYYERKGNQAKMEEAVKKVGNISRKNGYMQYYYFGLTMWINYLQSHNQQLAAMDELAKMKEIAYKDNYPYGISSYYKVLGNTYWMRSDYQNAKETYKQGLEYFKKNVKDQDQSFFNVMISRICIWQEKYDEAMRYVEDGLKNAKGESNRISLLMQKARLLFVTKKYDDFLALMKQIDEKKKGKNMDGNTTYIMVKAYQCLLEDKIEEAYEYANKMPNKNDRNTLLKFIAVAQGDWQKAYNYLANSMGDFQNRVSNQQSDDIAELNARFQNERLHSEMIEQKMKADKLMHERMQAQKEMELMALTNANMEMRQTAMSDSIDRAKLIIDKTRLTMNTELAKKKAEVEKAQRANLQSKLQSQKILFIAGSLVMVAIVASLVWNRRKSRLFINELSEKNDELTIARDKAEQSEKMKTMFIQNVSHEIRTPLNAIVGFSNLLVDPEMETSQEEKQEFKNIINNNTELLTALVNDVLTLSELQSGKAGLNIAPCSPNSLCRMAIKTVEHRKPNDVEILFTTNVSDNFTLNSDARRINQVLINFLTNAEKYTTQGSITVDCSKSADGFTTFTVTDTGCGIPKDKQEQIFNRFEKLDDFHQGMGLGLNICALIANILNAKIGIDDSYTNGARFYLSVKNNK